MLLAEAQSEKWTSLVRFALACVCAFVSLYFFALERISLTVCIMQIGLALLVCAYSAIFLVMPKGMPAHGYVPFCSVFFDVTVVSALICSLHIANLSPVWIHGTFFCAYFVAIAFSALHNIVSLPIFAGILVAAEYIALCIVLFFPGNDGANLVEMVVPGILMVLLAASISAQAAHNNLRSIRKISVTEGKYQSLVERVPLMLFTLDYNGCFLWVNSAAKTQLGYESEKLLGKNIREFIVEMDELRIGSLPIRGTFRARSREGESRFVDCIVKASARNEGNIAWEGSVRDVTDRELAISQREEMSSRLFQYQKVESLGTLASGMAHDFKNILQTVTDITERVSATTSESETKRGMVLISETLTDARFLISELLSLGRKKPLDYSSVNVAKLLRGVVPPYSDRLGPAYEVNLDVRDDDLWIQGDTDYLNRVFQNLFSNSRDAMPDGGIITVECFSVRSEGEDGMVVIRFSDTGTGIQQGILDKIFDPFFTTKKKGKGTGLGLALVGRIVALHRGAISVEKAGSSGTTFRIEMPASPRDEGDVDTKSILVSRYAATVLLLDDDPKIRHILKFFLSELSYDTCEASTVDDAVRVLRERRDECRVVVMDWKLGDEDPHQAIERFRSIVPGVTIIVVSGYPPEQQSIKQMKIFRWLTKPYDKNRLDLEIQKALYLADRS